MVRVSLFIGYSTRMELRAKRKELISTCPQSNVRRHHQCIRPVATTVKLSVTSANSGGAMSIGVMCGPTRVWGWFFPDGGC